MTHINGEPVERVEAFESLRAGDVVWVVGCRVCGERHRGMLTSLYQGTVLDGDWPSEDIGWERLPLPECCGPGGAVLCADAVNEGRLYRVVLDLEASATTEPARKPERVR